MTDERGLVVGVVAVVVVTAVVSGPLVSAVDLTGTGSFDTATAGTGSVDVGEVTLPESGEISAGRFGTNATYLRVPAASVEIQRVIGQPILTYRLSVPELGYTRESVSFVTERNEGQFSLTLGEASLDSADVSRESYTGDLSINVRSDTGSRTVANGTVTIEVVE